MTFTFNALALEKGVKALQIAWQTSLYIPLQDGDPVAAADIVCNLGREALVVHE